MKESKYIFLITVFFLFLITNSFRNSDPYNFHLASWMMGIGIAIDVFLATMSKFQDRELGFRNWTLPITATNIGFPAFGYTVFWSLNQSYPWLKPALGLVGFVLVALFVYEVICKSADKKPFFGISASLSDLIGLSENDTRRIIAVLAVSWDALFSGPAIAAQANAKDWSNTEVLGSFVIAGIVVAMIAQLALFFALKLQAKEFAETEQMAKWSFNGKVVELSVIGGFGVLSLLGGLELSDSIWTSILISGSVILITFYLLKTPIMDKEMEDALDAIGTDRTDQAAA